MSGPPWPIKVYTLSRRQDGRHFPEDIFKCIFLNYNIWISIKISLKFVPKGPINNSPALVQIMAWRRAGDKPLSEPMMVRLLTHICVTRPQWVKNTRQWAESSCLFHDLQYNSHTKDAHGCNVLYFISPTIGQSYDCHVPMEKPGDIA